MNQFRRVRRKARYAKKNCVKPAVIAASVSLAEHTLLTVEQGEPRPARQFGIYTTRVNSQVGRIAAKGEEGTKAGDKLGSAPCKAVCGLLDDRVVWAAPPSECDVR